jgi:hypothetical protein
LVSCGGETYLPSLFHILKKTIWEAKNERNKRKNDVVLGGAKYRRGIAIAARAWRKRVIAAKAQKLFAAVFRKPQ